MNKDCNFTDQQLAAMLKGVEEEKGQALRCLFLDKRLERSVFSKILGMGGSEEEAKNVYQDSFLLFNNHVQRGSFREESSPATFFVSICINHWKDSKRRNWNKKVALVDDPIKYDRPDEGSMENSLENTEIRHLARGVLKLTSDECKQLLMDQAKGQRLKEIAERLGIKEESVKNKIFRCREGIRQKAESTSGYLEFIKNILRWL